MKMFLSISGSNSYIYLVVFIVDLLGFMGGSLLTWTSPVLSKLAEQGTESPLGRNITSNEQSWIGSLSSIGGIIGPLVYAFIFENFGRKIGSIVIIFPGLISCLLAAFGKSVAVYYVARVLAGISIAAAFCVTPMYIGEVSPKHNRGTLITSSTIFIMAGCVFTYCIGPYSSIMVFNLILCVIPISALVGCVYFVPESPYYLVQKNRSLEALHSLQLLRGTVTDSVFEELKEIEDEVSKIRDGGVLDIFKTRAATKAFFITTTLVIFQLCSGISIMLAYTQSIFKEAGNSNSDILSIIVGSAQLLTILVTTFLVDKSGRKPLLYFSTSGVILSLVTMGVFFYLKDQNDSSVSTITWLPLAAFIAYVVFYNSGIGSLPWTIFGEIYPLNVKSAGTSIATSVYWSLGFLLNYFYSTITDAIGMGQTFWVFAGLSCGTIVFVYFCLIETKGKTLQEIQEILAT